MTLAERTPIQQLGLLRATEWPGEKTHLTPEQSRSFLPLYPDLAVELASPRDEGPRGATALRSKIGVYKANGAKPGWQKFPVDQNVTVDRVGGAERERVVGLKSLDAANAFPGLAIELEPIWSA